jgi:Rrf2 family protein
MLSRKAKYGLKAMMRLAILADGSPMLVADLATQERIPKQILLELRHRGLLRSKKGKGGGYMLARPASAVSMGEVIRALDGPIALIPCVSQTAYVKCDECLDERTCGIRLVMQDVRKAMCSILDNATLESVVSAVAGLQRGIEQPATTREEPKAPPRAKARVLVAAAARVPVPAPVPALRHLKRARSGR